MLKYEKKLHLDKYYNNLQSNNILHKLISLIWGIVGYAVLYCFIKYILTFISDIKPWSEFKPWFSLGGVLFTITDLIYFACGLILFCYSTIKLSKITIQNHSVRNDKSNTPKELLINGYYAKVRHPMYGTFIMLQAGFMFSLRSFNGIIIGMTIIVLQYVNAVIEEKGFLIPTFGEEYKIYTNNVCHMLLTKSEIVVLTLVALLSIVGLVF